MCQFHQMLIVRRYMIQDLDIQVSKKLLDLVNVITKTDKKSFIGAFNVWCEKYKDVINERVRFCYIAFANHRNTIQSIPNKHGRPCLFGIYYIKHYLPITYEGKISNTYSFYTIRILKNHYINCQIL